MAVGNSLHGSRSLPVWPQRLRLETPPGTQGRCGLRCRTHTRASNVTVTAILSTKVAVGKHSMVYLVVRAFSAEGLMSTAAVPAVPDSKVSAIVLLVVRGNHVYSDDQSPSPYLYLFIYIRKS